MNGSTGGDGRRGEVEVLAVAESDAYAKWAAWMLERAPAAWSSRMVLIRSTTSPSDDQLRAALVGTELAGAQLERLGLAELRRRLSRAPPDVILLACTGPTVAAITAFAVPRGAPSVIVSGLPGIGLPVRPRATLARSRTDVFIAHSRRELRSYSGSFRAHGASTEVALATLPFLADRPWAADRGTGRPAGHAAGDERLVFAAQPTVPATRRDREQLLRALAALGSPAPIVKLRGRTGDALTHDEPWPYPALWADIVASGDVDAEALDFVDGAMDSVLRRASCLITVSSTAAIEAIGRGIPVLVVDDFGVGPELLNDVFQGSGLIGPLSSAGTESARNPDPSWAEDNYFHGREHDDWTAIVSTRLATAASRRRVGPIRLKFALAASRRAVRIATRPTSRRQSAAIVGSPFQLLNVVEACHASAIPTPPIVVIQGGVDQYRGVLDLAAEQLGSVVPWRRRSLVRQLYLLCSSEPLVVGDAYSVLAQVVLSIRRRRSIVLVEDGSASLRAIRTLADGGGSLLRAYEDRRWTAAIAAVATRRLHAAGRLTVVHALPHDQSVLDRLRGEGIRLVRHSFEWSRLRTAALERHPEGRLVLGSSLAADGFLQPAAYDAWLDRLVADEPVTFRPHRRERSATIRRLEHRVGVTIMHDELPLELAVQRSPPREVHSLPSTAVLSLPVACPQVRVVCHPVPLTWWEPGVPVDMIRLIDDIVRHANSPAPRPPPPEPLEPPLDNDRQEFGVRRI